MTRKNGKSKDVEASLEQHLKLVDQQQHLNQQSQMQQDCAKKSEVMTHCLRAKWLIFMGLLFIISIILITLLVTINLNIENKGCSNSVPFRHQDYKLFSTKTSYSTVLSYFFDQVDASQESLKLSGLASVPLAALQAAKYGSEEIPLIFERQDSLSKIHNNLIHNQKCRVKQFHYFGRHASRYPSASEVEFINRNLANIQRRLDLNRFADTPNIDNQVANDSLLCINPLTAYKQWVSPLAVDRSNRLMESGYVETEKIAERFGSIYPEMFDPSKSNIEIGVTAELRTAQTATAFLKRCQQQRGDSNDQCQKEFLAQHIREKLEFHKKCQAYHQNNVTISYHLNADEFSRTRFITDSLNKRLKLVGEERLSPRETQAIYKICKYETALKSSSIWCNLFEENDLRFYEYLSDINDFYNSTYGHPSQYKSACPVTVDLYKAFKNSRSQTRPESYFYFTHSEVIQRILAASVDLEKDPAYSIQSIQNHLSRGTVPEVRQWRTSLLSPFAANIAFTLYQCPPKSGEGFIEFDVGSSNFKVVASLNEQPILLDGCSSSVCNLENLLEDSRLFEVKRCKLEDICRNNIIVT